MLSEQALAARREYQRAYREANKERVRQAHKEWRDRPENAGKVAEYRMRYWEKKAAMMQEQ